MQGFGFQWSANLAYQFPLIPPLSCELATKLNESVNKAMEEAREEDLRKKIEEDVTAKLICTIQQSVG